MEVGSSAEPADLVDRLLARGLVHDKEPYAVALVLTREPPPAPEGVEARRVETFEEYAAANAVQWEAFEMPEDEVAELRPKLPQMWSETVNVMHAVSIEGEVVAAGTSAPTEHGLPLYGGATLPRARGRGAYRAVLHARWQEAVANGTPALITQGGSMSRPILERLGFERVGEVHMLLDEFGGVAASGALVGRSERQRERALHGCGVADAAAEDAVTIVPERGREESCTASSGPPAHSPEHAVDGEGLVRAVRAGIRYLHCPARECARDEAGVSGQREAPAGDRRRRRAGKTERRVLDRASQYPGRAPDAVPANLPSVEVK